MGLNRICHYIKDNKTSTTPTDFIFFDTETTPKVNVDGDIEQPFKLGVGLYWRRRDDRSTDTLQYIRFKNIARFWRFVDDHTENKRRLLLVAHNLQFDFMVLGGFSYLRHLKYDLTKLIVNNKTNIFTYRRDKRTILCLDNQNYFDVSIKSLGETVGLPKLPMPKQGDTIKQWYTYCQRDVDIMYQAWRYWLSFIREQDLGTFGKTLASQAFNAYRHRFMEHPILVHTNSKATELERSSYRGGRVECFQLGHLPEQKYSLLDINSLYPYCMKSFPYPTRLRYLKEGPSLSFVARVLENHAVIADCLVEVDRPIFGVKHHNRLIFPIGTFRVTLTSQELEAALSLDALRKVYRMAVYNRDYIFTSFVDYFYNQRLSFKGEGKDVYAHLCKYILNKLYGKFGQRNEEWQFVGTEPSPVDYVITEIDAQTGKRYTIRCIAGQICKTHQSVEGYNSFAAISSEVTANARLLLWGLMERAGRGNVYYCDTDSLILDCRGSEGVSDSVHRSELGKLKLVKRSSDITLHNVKDYVISGKVKIKGISKTAKKVADDEYITYQQQGVRSGLHNQAVNSMVWRKVPKKLRRLYEKGIVVHDTEVYPLILDYAFETNWTDYRAMREKYGEYATYRGKYLDDIMKWTTSECETPESSLEDYSPDDRLAIKGDLQEQRRAGTMIYQRGRNR